MKLFIVVLSLIFSNVAFSASGECEKLWWKLAKKDGQYGTYRGKVKPGTDVVYLELWNTSKLIGQSRGYPNPSGTFEIHLHADYKIKKSHREKFTCKSY